MSQVQVRVPEKLLETLDQWIEEGRFKSRSDAVRVILSQYEEREREGPRLPRIGRCRPKRKNQG
jgi:Arc/MetJ-type ribon-helix-helix transcriptional regulator